MINRLFALVACVLLSSIAFAQVNGVVTDRSGNPIIAANVFWANTTIGTTTDIEGNFMIKRTPNSQKLVVSYIGYENDTTVVSSSTREVKIEISEGVTLNEVSVVKRKIATSKLRSSVMNVDVLSDAELCRAACCNLGESFTTNPSVDVSYSDAATGAKQIQLLGLSGTYVQMLTENIPNFRGAASPYGLGYVPGTWMQSIQVSKGISSVKNGYEALTGQINVEFKKPQTSDVVSANIFASTSQRFEVNADAATNLTDKWSTMIFAHGENETMGHDSNNDGFLDLPKVKQYHLFNRWAYDGDAYKFQAGIKGLQEERISGQMDQVETPYTVGISTDRIEGFIKQAYIFDKAHNSNVALILSGSIHNQDAHFGLKRYNVDQQNGYASLMYETEFSPRHSLSTGLSLNYDEYDQRYRVLADGNEPMIPALEREIVPGAYAQYTFNMDDKLILMAGLRGDHSSKYGYFMTPRAHIKYLPSEMFHLRLSAGKGYRTNHVLAENNYLLASSREVIIEPNLLQEEAWNYGASLTSYIPICGKDMTVNLEYFYTNFLHQAVVDMDSNPHQIAFTNLDGDSYSHVFQAEVSYPIVEGLTLTAAYRDTNVKTTYNGVLMDKPLTSKYKGLFTTSYQTPMGIWQFDATVQLNGGGRMPTPYTLADGSASWASSYDAFEQLNFQVTRYFRYWSVYVGGENLTNFTQSNPIIDASNPWGSNFDSSMIWGPVHGAKVYIGARFNIDREF